jgi:hypothetical protein
MINKQYTVYDNIVPEFVQDEILKGISTTNFPWYYYPLSVSNKDITVLPAPGVDYHEQFVHGVVWENRPTNPDTYSLIRPLWLFFQSATGIEIKDLIRIKINLLVNKQELAGRYNVPHTDHEDPEVKTLLYYVNDSDGDTVLFDQVWPEKHSNFTKLTTISPKKGRMIYFDAVRWHASSNPVNTKARMIININFR